MDRLLTVIAIVSLVLAAVILRSVRREHIRVEHSVSWLVFAVCLFLLSRFAWIRERLAHVLGVDDPPLLVLLVIVGISLVVFYRFSVVISSLKDANVALAQRVAILEYHIDSANEEKQAR